MYQPWRRTTTDRSWTGKREYARLSGEMATCDEATFRRLALALLRLIWSPPGELLDESFVRAGCGWLVPGSSSSAEVFIQLLTFQGPPESLGGPAVERVAEATRRFLESEIDAQGYLLLHNADLRSAEFRSGVDRALGLLSGRVERAEAWDRQRLVRDAFNAMVDHMLAAARSGALAFPSVVEAMSSPEGEPLGRVPLRGSLLTFDQYRLRGEEELMAPCVDDPARVMLAAGEGNVSLLLGQFGFGKTTAAARALQSTDEVLYVPGAAMSEEVKGAKDFLARCVSTERLLADCAAADREVYERVLRAAVEFLFKDPTWPLSLIIDGLDESVFLSRQGGLLHLFNNLRQVSIPVVLSMRTEFWLARRHELDMAAGIIARQGGTRRLAIRAIELLPWGDAQVLLFVQRARDRWEGPPGRERLAQLAALVENGGFEVVYGDIPRRPLFLRFITESVAEQGLPAQGVGRARLVRDWAERKILRDIANAQAAGGARPWIAAEGEPADAVVRIAWEAMLWAAASMTGEHEGALELLPDCALERVVEKVPEVERGGDVLGLHLQSLLLPASRGTGSRLPRVAFAHSAFQEFFLAWFLLREGAPGASSTVSESVRAWMRDLEREGLVAASARTEGPPGLPVRAPEPYAASPASDSGAVLQIPDLELLVEERPGGEGRVFDLRLKAPDPELDLNYREVGEIKLRAEPAEFFRRQLGEIWKSGKPRTAEGWASSAALLRQKGAYLSDTLLPAELKRRLAGLTGRVRTLLIQSDDPWIPWEMLRLPASPDGEAADGPFLCEAFVLTRWLPKIRQTRFLPLRRIAVVVPRDSGLPQAEGECADLLALADGDRRRVERIPARLADLQAAFRQGEHDGWHFTGHGIHREDAPDLSSIALEAGEQLTPVDLAGESKRMGIKRPLVFLNACSSGKSGESLTEMGGWAPHFLRAGAGACIGALWPIDDVPARDFARAFYAGFTAGLPIAEALLEARQAIRSDGNPTWLAYTIFAHPLAVCAPPDASRRPAVAAAARGEGPTNAPSRPAIFVGRGRDLAAVKARLGVAGEAAAGSRVQVLTAVRGWPGVGKSTLAVELAYDAEVRAAFPGGILWASIGESPDLLAELAGWGRLLGGEALQAAANLKEAVDCLRSLLRGRRALLVLDDVWDPALVLPVESACAEGCAILLTTREPGVAHTVAALPQAVYTLEVLDEPAALELLAALAPEVVASHPEACRMLVRELECLPLALQVAGRLLHAEHRMGWGVGELLRDLCDGRDLLRRPAPPDRADPAGLAIPTVEALLRRSTDRLDPLARERFRLLGGFVAKPATFGLEMLSLAWSVDDPRPTVRQLVERGLLEPAGDERFQMHALLVDHAAALQAEHS